MDLPPPLLKGTRTSEAAVNYAPRASSFCTKDQFTIMYLCCCTHVCVCVCVGGWSLRRATACVWVDNHIFWDIRLDPTFPSSSAGLDSLRRSQIDTLCCTLLSFLSFPRGYSFAERKANDPGVYPSHAETMQEAVDDKKNKKPRIVCICLSGSDDSLWLYICYPVCMFISTFISESAITVLLLDKKQI